VVEAQTKQLMQAVAYRGPLDVGYRFDARDGKYKLLDVNPRIGSTFPMERICDKIPTGMCPTPPGRYSKSSAFSTAIELRLATGRTTRVLNRPKRACSDSRHANSENQLASSSQKERSFFSKRMCDIFAVSHEWGSPQLVTQAQARCCTSRVARSQPFRLACRTLLKRAYTVTSSRFRSSRSAQLH